MIKNLKTVRQEKPIPNFIAFFMYLMHSKSRLKTELKLINSSVVKNGYKVLDFGCGPGTLTIEMAKLAAPEGKVFAMDIHPLAIKLTEFRAKKALISNIETKLVNDLNTGLADGSIDTAFLFNVIGMVKSPSVLIKEMIRITRLNGNILIFSKMPLARDIHNLIRSETIIKWTKDFPLDLIESRPKYWLFKKV